MQLVGESGVPYNYRAYLLLRTGPQLLTGKEIRVASLRTRFLLSSDGSRALWLWLLNSHFLVFSSKRGAQQLGLRSGQMCLFRLHRDHTVTDQHTQAPGMAQCPTPMPFSDHFLWSQKCCPSSLYPHVSAVLTPQLILLG